MDRTLMVEVVKVPVVGPVKKPVLYAGGAAVAGIVGYAWWTRGGIIEDETTDVELPATEYEPPTVVDSGISVGGPLSQGEPIARTNVEWSTMAREQADAFGASVTLSNSAISKYIAKDRLTVAEAALMAAIVGVLGQPPTGGPYSILAAPIEPPPAHVSLPALTVTKSAPLWRNGAYEYVISWLPVQGAARYYFEHVGGSTGHITATKTNVIRARAGQLDVWRFAAVSASNERGPVTTVTTQMPGAGAAAARDVASVGLIAGGSSRYGVAFPAASGMRYYRIRWEKVGGGSSGWATVRPVKSTHTWRHPRGTKFRVKVQASPDNRSWSAGRASNYVTAR